MGQVVLCCCFSHDEKQTRAGRTTRIVTTRSVSSHARSESDDVVVDRIVPQDLNLNQKDEPDSPSPSETANNNNNIPPTAVPAENLPSPPATFPAHQSTTANETTGNNNNNNSNESIASNEPTINYHRMVTPPSRGNSMSGSSSRSNRHHHHRSSLSLMRNSKSSKSSTNSSSSSSSTSTRQHPKKDVNNNNNNNNNMTGNHHHHHHHTQIQSPEDQANVDKEYNNHNPVHDGNEEEDEGGFHVPGRDDEDVGLLVEADDDDDGTNGKKSSPVTFFNSHSPPREIDILDHDRHQLDVTPTQALPDGRCSSEEHQQRSLSSSTSANRDELRQAEHFKKMFLRAQQQAENNQTKSILIREGDKKLLGNRIIDDDDDADVGEVKRTTKSSKSVRIVPSEQTNCRRGKHVPTRAPPSPPSDIVVDAERASASTNNVSIRETPPSPEEALFLGPADAQMLSRVEE